MNILGIQEKYCIDKFIPPVAPVDKKLAEKVKSIFSKVGSQIGLTPRFGTSTYDRKKFNAQAHASIGGEDVVVGIHYDVDDNKVTISVTNGSQHKFFDNVAQYKKWALSHGGAKDRLLNSDKKKKVK